MTTEKNTIKRMKSNLDFVLKRSGLLDYITNEKSAILDEYRDAFREKTNIYEKDDVDFFAKLKLSREIVLRDFIWFMKVVSNPKKMLPLHEVCQRFIEEGHSHYRQVTCGLKHTVASSSGWKNPPSFS